MLWQPFPCKFTLEYFVQNSVQSKQYQSSVKTKPTHADKYFSKGLKNAEKKNSNDNTIDHHQHLKIFTCATDLPLKPFNHTINDSGCHTLSPQTGNLELKFSS